MKTLRIIKLICFALGAIMILLFKEFFVENLRWFIGGLIVLYGTLGIVGTVLEKVKPIYEGNGFLFFSVEMLIGLTVLLFVKEYSTVCIIWAAWSILRESVELKEIVSGELHPALAVVSGIESVAVIVLSVMLITEPGHHHALIHTYLLCIELVLTAAIPLLNHYVFFKHGEHEEKEEKE
ncbi:MAG: hypothetical protein J5832_00775, partial [Clostridia bacterium]|nr:hypothetical protein [Clostridia bacterium]